MRATTSARDAQAELAAGQIVQLQNRRPGVLRSVSMPGTPVIGASRPSGKAVMKDYAMLADEAGERLRDLARL